MSHSRNYKTVTTTIAKLRNRHNALYSHVNYLFKINNQHFKETGFFRIFVLQKRR